MFDPREQEWDLAFALPSRYHPDVVAEQLGVRCVCVRRQLVPC